jgi:hypothetical protein
MTENTVTFVTFLGIVTSRQDTGYKLLTADCLLLTEKLPFLRVTGWLAPCFVSRKDAEMQSFYILRVVD